MNENHLIFYKKSLTNIESYSFDEHKNRYAVWTAARAVQRSFTTTKNISKAIDATGLKRFAQTSEPINQAEFDALHKQWCKTIISSIAPLPCSYGRAAKIVAIYLKTAVVLPACGTGNKSLVIHPPIDRILLQTIAGTEGMKELIKKNWTAFEEGEYWELVSLLRDKFKVFNWTLEVYWKPEKEKASYVLPSVSAAHL